MGRRPVRIALLVSAMLATAGLGYRAMANDRGLATARLDGARLDQAAEEALAALLDIRGSMHAYVAPNQGTKFWGGRVETLLDTLRRSLVALDAAAAASDGSLAEALDGIDQLTAADARARQYADRGELLLAADVLFTEVRDLVKAATDQVLAVRHTLRNDADRTVSGIRQEQVALALGGAALWLMVALALLPGTTTASKEPGEWRHELKNTLNKPAADDLGLELKKTEPVVAAVPDLKIIADLRALAAELARASDVIGAKGLIVWVASHDRASLSAVSSYGIDARVVERFGSINRLSANLTADAFCENAPRTRAASDSAAAALAVPLGGPYGPVGVLSAELQPGKAPDEGCVAAASVVATQLTILAAPFLTGTGAKVSKEEPTGS